MFKNKINDAIILRVAIVLLMLVMVTTSVIAGLYAKYTTRGTDYDNANVAKFRIIETGEMMMNDVQVAIVPGGEDETVLVVENAGEVSIKYTIDASNPYRNLPLGFKIKLGGTSYPVPFEGEIASGETHTYVLVTYWDSPDRGIEYSGKVDVIEIGIKATQID